MIRIQGRVNEWVERVMRRMERVMMRVWLLQYPPLPRRLLTAEKRDGYGDEVSHDLWVQDGQDGPHGTGRGE